MVYYNIFITCRTTCQSLMSANHRHRGDLWMVAVCVCRGDDAEVGCSAHSLLPLWWNRILGSELQPLLIRNDILCPGFGHTVTYAVILKKCCFMHLMKTRFVKYNCWTRQIILQRQIFEWNSTLCFIRHFFVVINFWYKFSVTLWWCHCA